MVNEATIDEDLRLPTLEQLVGLCDICNVDAEMLPDGTLHVNDDNHYLSFISPTGKMYQVDLEDYPGVIGESFDMDAAFKQAYEAFKQANEPEDRTPS